MNTIIEDISCIINKLRNVRLTLFIVMSLYCFFGQACVVYGVLRLHLLNHDLRASIVRWDQFESQVAQQRAAYFACVDRQIEERKKLHTDDGMDCTKELITHERGKS